MPSSAAACSPTRFITERPDVARRYAAAWTKAIRDIQKDPDGARRHLLKNTLTPDDVVDGVTMLGYFVVLELSNTNKKKEFQDFIDFSMKLIGATEKVETLKYMKAF